MEAIYVDNTEYENRETESEETAAETDTGTTAGEKRPRDLFAYWNVDGETYKLKLTTSTITELERIYKCNLLNLMGELDHLPSLTTMLQITHAAMKEWHHGIKLAAVNKLFDKYLASGKSQLQFYVEVFMKIYAVSGFFSMTMSAELSDDMEEALGKM